MMSTGVSVLPVTIPGAPTLDASLALPEGDGPWPVAVLAHGLLSCKEEFCDFPADLAKAGIAALSFDFRGHGKSEGERGLHTAEWHVGDLARAVAFAEERSDLASDRMVLVGHSLGNAAVLALLAGGGARFRGGALLAPGGRNLDIIKPLEQVMYKAAYGVARVVHELTGHHLQVPYPFKYRDLYYDPWAVARAEQQDFLQHSLSLMNYPYVIAGVDNPATAKRVEVPMLVVVGGEDRVIANDQSRQTFDALAATDKEWVRAVGLGHSMLGDGGGDQVSAIIVQWVKGKVA